MLHRLRATDEDSEVVSECFGEVPYGRGQEYFRRWERGVPSAGAMSARRRVFIAERRRRTRAVAARELQRNTLGGKSAALLRRNPRRLQILAPLQASSATSLRPPTSPRHRPVGGDAQIKLAASIHPSVTMERVAKDHTDKGWGPATRESYILSLSA